MRYSFYILICLLICAMACKDDMETPADKSDVQDERVSQQPNANGELAKPEVVKEMEPEDRIIWQKPDLVIQRLGPLAGKTVADIGAGTGYFTFRIARSADKVIAIDIDPQMIEWMQKQKARFQTSLKGAVDVRLATSADPNLSSKEADVALMVNTYIYLGDRIEYLKNLKRGLKPGARLVIVDFKKKNTAIGPPIDQRVSLLQVETELKQAGYKIIDHDDTSLEYQYFVSAELIG